MASNRSNQPERLCTSSARSFTHPAVLPSSEVDRLRSPRRNLGHFQTICLQEKPIATVLTQDEVTVQRLIAHLADDGLSPIQLDDKQVRLRTESGIGFHIAIEADRQCIRFHTYLPTSRTKDRQEKLVFVHQMNVEIFLATFCLDSDDDVLVNYVLPFQYGLITEQLIALVHRFSSLLEYLVQSYDANAMFDFGQPTINSDSIEQLQSPMVRPEGTLLN